jgi:Cd2+/Zn2+-exporting ATPase
MRSLQSVLTLVCAVFLVASWLPGVPGEVAYISVAAGSYFALKSAWESVRKRSLDVNLLMVLAAVGGIAVGHVADAAALLFLFSLSSTLESMAMSKTRSAIESLMRLRPDSAIRVLESGDETVQTTELKPGDKVRVRPFDQIPVDGTLVSEAAEIDESAMTGESRPVTRVIGEPVLGGTQNLDRMMLLTVTSAPGDNTLDKVVALVEDAQQNKATGERISQWFGQRYTLFVMAVFIGSLMVRYGMSRDWGASLYTSLILLVALSPCALVISTPAATLSALAAAARKGILVRGGEFMERAGRVQIIAFDKTGTLTAGRPKVVEVCVAGMSAECVAAGSCPATASGAKCEKMYCWHAGDALGPENAEALRIAASAEAFSSHPIATAIVDAANAEKLVIPIAEDHQAIPGMGIITEVEGKKVKIGQPRFFSDAEEGLPGGFREHVAEMQSRGLTSVIMRFGEQWAALGVRDEPRPAALAALKALRATTGARLVMLTGDNPQTAKAIGDELGVDEVWAGLLPADKEQKLAEWQSQGIETWMVGDGVNDAPALARASMGVAMGGLGSDVALQAADVVLVGDRLDRLPNLVRLGQRTQRVIRTNLVFAAGMITVLTVLSFVWGQLPFLTSWSATMPLPLAVVGHEGSTVLVILNGLRLLNAAE